MTTLNQMTNLLNEAMDNKFGSDYAGYFDISYDEAERIAEKCETAEQFHNVWADEDWWTDENNA